MTKYTYWGRFGCEQNKKGITDVIIENRNKFADQFKISPALTGSERPYGLICDCDNDGAFDHIEFYRSRYLPGHIILVTSPYHIKSADEDRLISYGFKRYDPIYHVNAQTFVKVFHCKKDLISFVEDPRLVDFNPRSSLHDEYVGTIIYATPGSGKTRFVENQQSDSVIDADEIILKIVSERHPSFLVDPDLHPGKNLLRFCRQFDRLSLDPIYEEARQVMLELARNGYTVLTGSIALMDLADYVFVQKNHDILADKVDYDQTREEQAALALGKYIPICFYMDAVLVSSPSQL
eukprot:scaffold2000_cov48-Attheya_sp.AAC.8